MFAQSAITRVSVKPQTQTISGRLLTNASHAAQLQLMMVEHVGQALRTLLLVPTRLLADWVLGLSWW